MIASLKNFVKTLDDKTRVGKIGMREEVLDSFLDVVSKSSSKNIKILTLPSLFWEFERLFLKTIDKKHPNISISVHAFEMDWKIFCAACLKIPKSIRSKYQQGTFQPLDYQIVRTLYTSHSLVLYHTNVFNYIGNMAKKFDCVWIDLVCPIDHYSAFLPDIGKSLNDDGVIVLSFIKGREKIKIENRLQYVIDLMPDLELIKVVEYKDTTCMINYFFKKKIDYEQLISL